MLFICTVLLLLLLLLFWSVFGVVGSVVYVVDDCVNAVGVDYGDGIHGVDVGVVVGMCISHGVCVGYLHDWRSCRW